MTHEITLQIFQAWLAGYVAGHGGDQDSQANVILTKLTELIKDAEAEQEAVRPQSNKKSTKEPTVPDDPLIDRIFPKKKDNNPWQNPIYPTNPWRTPIYPTWPPLGPQCTPTNPLIGTGTTPHNPLFDPIPTGDPIPMSPYEYQPTILCEDSYSWMRPSSELSASGISLTSSINYKDHL